MRSLLIFLIGFQFQLFAIKPKVSIEDLINRTWQSQFTDFSYRLTIQNDGTFSVNRPMPGIIYACGTGSIHLSGKLLSFKLMKYGSQSNRKGSKCNPDKSDLALALKKDFKALRCSVKKVKFPIKFYRRLSCNNKSLSLWDSTTKVKIGQKSKVSGHEVVLLGSKYIRFTKDTVMRKNPSNKSAKLRVYNDNRETYVSKLEKGMEATVFARTLKNFRFKKRIGYWHYAEVEESYGHLIRVWFFASDFEAVTNTK